MSNKCYLITLKKCVSSVIGIGVSVVGLVWDSWGCCYSAARGEILRFPEEQLMRKHSPRMSSLIKNESWGIEDDQIPS
ncbi:hypothetical protein AAMO2058_000791500 [Amorphochlora amoebiformis]